MKTKTLLYSTLSTLILSGCAQNSVGVTPSQNNNLQAVSPSVTATSKGGMMQHSLDSWLKEEWSPMTDTAPTVNTTTSPDGTVVQTKTEIIPSITTTTAPDGKTVQMKTEKTQVVTTTTAPTGEVVTTTAVVKTVDEPVDEAPFTLQKYVDKWKVYQENKEKMDEGKPKKPSEVEKLQSLPVIGK
jgi:hypothetical protein